MALVFVVTKFRPQTILVVAQFGARLYPVTLIHENVILSAVFRPAKRDENKRRTYAFPDDVSRGCVHHGFIEKPTEQVAEVGALLSPENARVLRRGAPRVAKCSASSG